MKKYSIAFIIYCFYVVNTFAMSQIEMQQLSNAKKEVQKYLTQIDSLQTPKDLQEWEQKIDALMPIIQKFDSKTAANFTLRKQGVKRIVNREMSARQPVKEPAPIQEKEPIQEVVQKIEDDIKEEQKEKIVIIPQPIDMPAIFEMKKDEVMRGNYANYSSAEKKLTELAKNPQYKDAESQKQIEQEAQKLAIAVVDYVVSAALAIKEQLQSTEQQNWFTPNTKGRFDDLQRFLGKKVPGAEIVAYFEQNKKQLAAEAAKIEEMVQKGIVEQLTPFVQQHMRDTNEKTNLKGALRQLSSKTNLYGAFDKVIDSYKKLIEKAVVGASAESKKVLHEIVTAVIDPLADAQQLLHGYVLKPYLKEPLVTQDEKASMIAKLVDITQQPIAPIPTLQIPKAPPLPPQPTAQPQQDVGEVGGFSGQASTSPSQQIGILPNLSQQTRILPKKKMTRAQKLKKLEQGEVIPLEEM